MLPSQELLSGWFETLWNTFQKQDKLGRVLHQTWYQTEGGLKEYGNSSDTPIYNVRILKLPEVTKNRRIYFPKISETTIYSGIFPETVPEIETWRLDLNIGDKTGQLKMPQIQFSCLRYRKPNLLQKYEIKFEGGKQLTGFEVNSVKSIYDAAVGKLSKI